MKYQWHCAQQRSHIWPICINFVARVMLKINIFVLQFVLKNIRQFDFFIIIKCSRYNRSSKSCSISANAVTNHARHAPNNLQEKRCLTKENNMILLHNISRVFEITFQIIILWADMRLLLQNEADYIFYAVKAMLIIIGLHIDKWHKLRFVQKNIDSFRNETSEVFMSKSWSYEYFFNFINSLILHYKIDSSHFFLETLVNYMSFCLVVFFSEPNRAFCEQLHPYYQHYHLLCNAKHTKSYRFGRTLGSVNYTVVILGWTISFIHISLLYILCFVHEWF